MRFAFQSMALLLGLVPGLALAATAGETGDATRVSASRPASDGGGQGVVTGEEPGYSTTVRAPPPVSSDVSQDALEVDGERLRQSSRSSTLEALAAESAGIHVTARGVGGHGVAAGASGGITIRGLGGSPNTQVLMVEDGVPDYQGIFGHPIPDAYVPFLIDRVLVIKGGDSVLFGTNALGAVVVIRNRVLRKDGFGVLSDSAYGSYSTLRQMLAFLLKYKKWDVSTALHVGQTDGHRQGADARTLVAHARVGLGATSRLRLSLQNKVVHLKGSDPGPATHPFAGHWYDVWRETASVAMEYVAPRYRIEARPFVNLGVHRLHDGFKSLDYVAGGILESRIRIHGTLRLVLGASSEHVGGDVSNVITSEAQSVSGSTNVSFYNQLTYQPLPALSFVAGTRELYSTQYGFFFLYKAGAWWDIYRGLHVRTRIARNLRQPTIRELHLPFPVANPDLKPEVSLNWDFGLGYSRDCFEISATGYRTAATNMIRYFGSWPSAEVVNIDSIEIWGLEAMARVKRLGPVSASLSGNLQRVGRYTRQNPSAKLSFTLEAGHSFGPHRIHGSLSGEWVHGLYMGNYKRDPIDDVFFMDVTLRYRYSLLSRNLTLEPYLLLRNITDSRYSYVEGYPMPGFNLLAGLRVGI